MPTYYKKINDTPKASWTFRSRITGLALKLNFQSQLKVIQKIKLEAFAPSEWRLIKTGFSKLSLLKICRNSFNYKVT